MQTEKVIDHIVTWLKDYALNSGTSGFVLGISGGIDSAVVSTLCAKTKLPTLCAELPIHQAQSQISRAREQLSFLEQQFENTSRIEIDLTSVFDTLQNLVPESDDPTTTNLALANSRARLRMTTLYHLAGIHGYLVAGTGNKIEDFGVGFFTKYGDGGVDISPIGDLMKSEVYALAHALGIPLSIQEAIPTDGLFGDDRSDEAQLGATYDELEWAMKQHDRGAAESEFEGRKQDVYKIYERLNRINQHKMKPIPICTIPSHLK